MIDQLPSTTSLKGCNPYFCDSNHKKSLNPEKLEKCLKDLFASSKVSFLFMVMIKIHSSPGEIIARFIKSLTSPNLSSATNLKSLEKFRKDFDNELQNLLVDQSFDDVLAYFTMYLIRLSKMYHFKKVCISSWTNNKFVENTSLSTSDALSMFFSHGSREVIGPSYHDLPRRGWNDSQIEALSKLLSSEIILAFVPRLENSRINQWLNFITEKGMSASRVASYAILTDWLIEEFEDGCLGPEGTALPVESIMKFWYEVEVEKKKALILDAEDLKQYGDGFAESKRYHHAVWHYGRVNFLGLTSSVLLHSLTNSAAIRLRIAGAERKPRQVPIAILECALALEIDPNHTKALFRRGLGLAISKKWNEAIIDFERALELDPNSPAKKELEVARRQVTRRVGGSESRSE